MDDGRSDVAPRWCLVAGDAVPDVNGSGASGWSRARHLVAPAPPSPAAGSGRSTQLIPAPRFRPPQMRVKRLELCFSLLFVASYFTNKYVLSILNFTYPTLFQGWQTIMGTVLLQVAWKLGWLEMRSTFLWSAKVSWLPAVFMFVGSIYTGSRALSKLKLPCTTTSSMLVIFTASVILLWNIFKYESGSFFWAVTHVTCAGGYKVFQKLKSCALSELEQQYLSYLYSMVFLICAAYPSGDAFDVLTFPFFTSYRFHSGCCARCSTLTEVFQLATNLVNIFQAMRCDNFVDYDAQNLNGILGVSLQVVSVKLKNCVSTVWYSSWMLVTKVLAACMSLAVFQSDLNIATSCCLVLGVLGEAILIYTSMNGPEVK
ncbi:transmembrane protein 241-like isoform X4 [Mobula hypostoma]|uniref:transmembrane protein 241-like isoform X4 n=1 Tax=Mobula hypostoma TaxID=723540 RepID=UPI002FC3B9D5